MNAALMAALGACTGVGVLFVLAGVTGRKVLPSAPAAASGRFPLGAGKLTARIAAGVLAALVVWALTGWIAGGLLLGGLALAAPRLVGGTARRKVEIARTEAIASWTEMIRDSIVAASGLEEAIVATEKVAPRPIAPEVRALVHRLQHQRLDDSLDQFGAALHHPSADMVVTSLVLAIRMEASDLSGLLTRLADAIRGDARMRVRVEVGRARVRTATKVIIGTVAAAAVFLAVTNRDYLSIYNTATGQLVLVVIAAVFALGGWLLERMADTRLPERFTARTTAPGGAR